ncbi:hypothetical protein ICN48_06235 [Polynucleobacter sp. JS-Safj-400b-B2]|uniref:hypothetical protein n=1 Tax=Polynucleobacter sp. JS-Safj-400b-B2 TaxID=2576921 RepID=UPI001C0C7194|nr:hypothetical protein [Polynucleobacter sp. JS-Safj-400b-B2]MBU3625830.1 hypothetical protein [Polynucleobacter sp. JS-Safj-400b-B2]
MMNISGNTTIKQLLAMVKKCKTDDDADTFRFEFRDILMGMTGNALDVFNEASYIEKYTKKGAPYISFELVRVFSDAYVYAITPTIQDGELTIICRLDHMKDGLGIYSKDYEPVEGWDDEVPYYPDNKLKTVIARAVNIMLAAHTKLIEDVGVPTQIARKTAEDSWGGPIYAEQ